MEKVIVGLGVGVVAVAIWAAVMWCIWSLWGFVLPQVYPTGPAGLIAPGFWLFAACWTLMGMIGRAIFGSRSKD